MRFVYLFIASLLTVSLCYILDTTILLKIPLGKLLSPQEGIWQNAESVNAEHSATLNLDQLEGKVDVYFDDRMVPHVFAENENDLFFVQGYLHAKNRLWQMELQTHFAAGRLSEIVGKAALNHDREFRRLGMVYAAEQSLKQMEQDQAAKKICDAYTAGVNAYIAGLTKSKLPIEYKLLGYQPEAWSNLKSALFLKYMSYDLAGHQSDFEMTNAKAYFKQSDFDLLFPMYQKILDPVIPRDAVYPVQTIFPTKPSSADSLYFGLRSDTAAVMPTSKPNKANGSNNWAVAAYKTKNGAPILCNDPHLGLKLPSVWYEMQLSTPSNNVYGVSFPGAPGVMIGFNDQCAFGFTNGGRDVCDFYEISFKDKQKSAYWFDSVWVKTSQRIERIKIAGEKDVMDTVSYTAIGPVMYDDAFAGKYEHAKKSYAVKWTAHNNSNEMKMFYLLNKAKHYNDYTAAIKYLETPGQNSIFACKNGDIALTAQGGFPAKWKGQGDFIMPGFDSSYFWQGMIPEHEKLFQYNPIRGFVSSANQAPADSTYPYYLGTGYPNTRGLYINRKLSQMEQISIQDMMKLQTDNYNIFAEMSMPIILNNVAPSLLNAQEKTYLQLLKQWNFQSTYISSAATLFDLTWKKIYDTIYVDEYADAPQHTAWPENSTLQEALLYDSSYAFIDNRNTADTESLKTIVTAAFKTAALEARRLEIDGKLAWGKFKDTHISHLLKLDAFSRNHIQIGGGENIINATTSNHGPSWRMIVSLTPETEAYGIYPGGQSGNAGSYFYDDAIDNWAEGKYYKLWMMTKAEEKDTRIKSVLHFRK